MGLPVVGDGCCRIEIDEDGLPHGVSTSRVAARVKPGSDEMPVPPMTAMCTGAVCGISIQVNQGETERVYHRMCLERLPFCDTVLRRVW